MRLDGMRVIQGQQPAPLAAAPSARRSRGQALRTVTYACQGSTGTSARDGEPSCSGRADRGDEAPVAWDGLPRRQVLGAAAVLAATAGLGVASARPAFAAEANKKELEVWKKDFGEQVAQKLLRREGEIAFSEDEWKERLDDAQYKILRLGYTERPFTSELYNEKRLGLYTCGGCGTPLFASTKKFNSGTGWPSFYQSLPGAVVELADYSLPMLPRTEVRCATCYGHLGHVFEDGPKPTGLRYCMNGKAMLFAPIDDSYTKSFPPGGLF